MPRKTEKERIQEELMKVEQRIRTKEGELAKLRARKSELVAKQNRLH